MGIYRGIAYPICKHPLGLLHNTNDIAQVKSDIATVILTKRGERIMEPTFGVPWDALNFAQPKEILINDTRHMVAFALQQWEKRVQIEDIQVKIDINEELNRITVKLKIFFIDPRELQNIQELIIEKYIGGIDGRGMPF